MSVSARDQILEYLDGPKQEDRYNRTALDNMRLGDATTDQLQHYLACRRVLEEHLNEETVFDELCRLNAQADEETIDAFGRTANAQKDELRERVFGFAQWGRSIGIGDDLIGNNLARKLLGFGYGEEETAGILKDIGIDWHQKTARELLVSIAAGMLRDGWSKEAVRHALDGLVNDGR